MESTLESLQAAIEEKIRSIVKISAVHIGSHPESSASSQIEHHSATATGMSITVMPPIPLSVRPNVPGPVFNKIEVTVQISEHLYTCSSLPGLLFMGEMISKHLHFWTPEISSWNSCLHLSTEKPWDISSELYNTNTLNITFHIIGDIISHEN